MSLYLMLISSCYNDRIASVEKFSFLLFKKEIELRVRESSPMNEASDSVRSQQTECLKFI